jgi:hypothetical protein
MLSVLERVRPAARLLASTQAINWILPLGGFCLLGSLVVIQYSPTGKPARAVAPPSALHRVVTDEVDLTREGHDASQVADLNTPPEPPPPIGKPDQEMTNSPLSDGETPPETAARVRPKPDHSSDDRETTAAGDAAVAMAAPPAPDAPPPTPAATAAPRPTADIPHQVDVTPRHEKILGEHTRPPVAMLPRHATDAPAPVRYQEGYDPTPKSPVVVHKPSTGKVAAHGKAAAKPHKAVPPPPGEIVDIPLPSTAHLDDPVESLRQSSQNDLARRNELIDPASNNGGNSVSKQTEVPPLPHKSWTPSFADMEVPSLPMPAGVSGSSLMAMSGPAGQVATPPHVPDLPASPSHVTVSTHGTVTILGRIKHPGVAAGATAHDLVYLVDMTTGQTIHGSTDGNGNFSFAGLKSGTLYYIAAWYQQRNVDGVRYNGNMPVANVHDVKLSWHQAIQPQQGGAFSLELNQYNADSAYCADVIPNAVVETPNASWRRAELLPVRSGS